MSLFRPEIFKTLLRNDLSLNHSCLQVDFEGIRNGWHESGDEQREREKERQDEKCSVINSGIQPLSLIKLIRLPSSLKVS